MRILLTGAEGRIGRHLAASLAIEGRAIRTLDIRPPTAPGDDAVVADLCDLDALRAAMADVDVVVHAGAIPTDVGDGSTVMATNVTGTWNVLQAAAEAGVPRVVAFSSINAIGCVGGRRGPDHLPVDDVHPHHPLSPYQLSKHLGEEICRSFTERYGMVTLCLRPVWVVGAEEYANAGFGTAPFMETWRPELWAYVDVRDVADAVERCLRVEGVLHDSFLLAAADTSASVPTATLVARHYGTLPWRGTTPAGTGNDPYHGLIDCSHARSVLGWAPRRSWRTASTSRGGEAGEV